VNITEIDDALSAALHSLSAAQAVLRKSLPGRSIDVLQKADGLHPRASASQLIEKRVAEAEAIVKRQDDTADALLAQLADLNVQVDKFGDAQLAPRKTAGGA
jgi:hypothetical protein